MHSFLSRLIFPRARMYRPGLGISGEPGSLWWGWCGPQPPKALFEVRSINHLLVEIFCCWRVGANGRAAPLLTTAGCRTGQSPRRTSRTSRVAPVLEPQPGALEVVVRFPRDPKGRDDLAPRCRVPPRSPVFFPLVTAWMRSDGLSTVARQQTRAALLKPERRSVQPPLPPSPQSCLSPLLKDLESARSQQLRRAKKKNKENSNTLRSLADRGGLARRQPGFKGNFLAAVDVTRAGSCDAMRCDTMPQRSWRTLAHAPGYQGPWPRLPDSINHPLACWSAHGSSAGYERGTARSPSFGFRRPRGNTPCIGRCASAGSRSRSVGARRSAQVDSLPPYLGW